VTSATFIVVSLVKDPDNSVYKIRPTNVIM